MKHPHKSEVNENVEVWEDLVRIKDLVWSLLICSFTSLGGYFLAPDDSSTPLFFGLIGALVGFILSSYLIKPKRSFHEDEGEDL